MRLVRLHGEVIAALQVTDLHFTHMRAAHYETANQQVVATRITTLQMQQHAHTYTHTSINRHIG